MKPVYYLGIGVLLGLLAAGVIWLAAAQPRGAPVVLLPTSTPGKLMVDVSGAVVSPGVYAVAPGSRINDAIQAAGGLAVGAEADQLNLAALLKDGDHIDVPGIVTTSHVSAGRININTATVIELDTLPGISPTTAQSIVDYRLENGPFQSIQDVANVPGIGPSTFDKIKDYITLGP